MADDTKLSVRVPERVRDLFNQVAARRGMTQGALLTHLVVGVAEHDLREQHPDHRLCVECGGLVEPDPDGAPQWHTHGGRIIGERTVI